MNRETSQLITAELQKKKKKKLYYEQLYANKFDNLEKWANF